MRYDHLVCGRVVACDWIVAVRNPNHCFDRDVSVPDSDVAVVGTPRREETHLEGSLLGNQGGAVVGKWVEVGDGESCIGDLRKEKQKLANKNNGHFSVHCEIVKNRIERLCYNTSSLALTLLLCRLCHVASRAAMCDLLLRLNSRIRFCFQSSVEFGVMTAKQILNIIINV